MSKYGPEDTEQAMVVNWLRNRGLDFFHPIQENVIKQPGYWNKMKAMGWEAGLSDLIIHIPADRCTSKDAGMLFIEMKQCKKKLTRKSVNGEAGDMVPVNKPTEPQLRFLEMVNSVPGCHGEVAYGYDEAVALIERFLLH